MSLLEKRAKELSQGLARRIARLADEVSPKSVHRLRSTIRRIESLVAFTRPDIGRKQRRALEDLAELRKRAGKVRDLDVQTDLLGTIANGSTASDRRELADLLRTKRLRQAKRLRSHIDGLQDSRFLEHLERIGEKVGMSGETLFSPFEEALRQLSDLAAEYRSEEPVPSRLLHQVRIRLKMIRYLAESSAESPEQQDMLTSLKSAQDALGAWHDWEELTATAEKLFGERLNCPLLMEIRALFAAKHSGATAAVAGLFSTVSIGQRRERKGSLARRGSKPPASTEASAALARPA
jgi:CHAD domain-containing protein